MNKFRTINFILMIVSGSVSSTMAQECTGSLGDPIINISFGTGTGFGPALAAGVTSKIQYLADYCPNDGFYTITNYSYGCWGSTEPWHRAYDHTGSADGYYMLVNASYEPSDFYIQPVDGLCEGTKYEFAVWVLNMMRFSGILPNLTMTIETTDGKVLQSYNTGDVAITNPYQWKQYGFYFTTPVGVSTVVIRMQNNAPGGIGNDVALDDITFRPAGPAMSLSIEGYSTDEITLCPENTDALHFVSTIEECFGAPSYQWQVSADSGRFWSNIPGAVNTDYTRLPTGPGSLYYRLATAPGSNISISNCRVASKPVKVNVPAHLHPKLESVDYVCKGDSLKLFPGEFETYRWQDGSTDSQYVVRTAGNYSVTVSNMCESATATTSVSERVCGVFFPSAFTPNEDGKNDVYKVISSFPVSSFKMEIFNRWGQTIFSTADKEKGWDGKVNGQAAAAGIYIWKSYIQTSNKKTMQQYNGKLLLIR
jgi:gliding motility-associated-like protein